MFAFILGVHSFVRWLVLISLIYALIRGFAGWIGKSKYSEADAVSVQIVRAVATIQFFIGLFLYFFSPATKLVMHSFSTAMSVPFARFFGFEHALMMLIAVVLISIGAARSQKAPTDKQKFARMTIFFLIALLVILYFIPWPFYHSFPRPLLRL